MEMLEALNKLVSNPKLEPGQYGEICAVLKKVGSIFLKFIYCIKFERVTITHFYVFCF